MVLFSPVFLFLGRFGQGDRIQAGHFELAPALGTSQQFTLYRALADRNLGSANRTFAHNRSYEINSIERKSLRETGIFI
jgi:hypothetical protein